MHFIKIPSVKMFYEKFIEFFVFIRVHSLMNPDNRDKYCLIPIFEAEEFWYFSDLISNSAVKQAIDKKFDFLCLQLGLNLSGQIDYKSFVRGLSKFKKTKIS